MQDSDILTACRIKNKYTQQEIANILKISLSTYKLYECGILPMTLEDLNTLSNFYNISLDFLLGLSSKNYTSHFRKSIDYRYLSFCIVFLRKRAKLTQKDMAEDFQISIRSLSRYEKEPQKITLDFLISISHKFNISIDYICGRSYEKEVL